MIKTTLKIEGMMCGMCESHMNDAIRNAFTVKKVTSSSKKSTTEILSEMPLDEGKLTEAVTQTGYMLVSVESAEAGQKKFSLFGHKD